MANKNNFKFLQLNKNDSDLRNCIDQINLILSQHKPQFFIINELQLHRYDSFSKFNFPGYKLEHDNLDKQDGWSRTGILVQHGIQYKQRKDLEGQGLSTVWLKVGVTGTKHFLLHAVYRQFQRQGNKPSLSHPSQQARWSQILTN